MIDTIFNSILVISGLAGVTSLVLFFRLVMRERLRSEKPKTLDLAESNRCVYGAFTIKVVRSNQVIIAEAALKSHVSEFAIKPSGQTTIAHSEQPHRQRYCPA